jgi:methionyl-tRNA formyltransferase
MKVLILAKDCHQTTILYNFLKDKIEIENIIIEENIKKIKFFKHRIKKLGFLKVLDQLFFILFVNSVLNVISKKRIREIISKYNLSLSPIPKDKITRVKNINHASSINLLKSFNVDCIILSGTRIISNNLISSVKVDLINIHAGITPNYRGVFGAYWAFVNNEKNIAGVTLHKVDKGVDTGEIIGQEIIEITKSDNVTTYPYIQIGIGIQILKKYLINGNYENKVITNGNSCQFYHPGLCQYFYYRIIKGIK